MASSFWMRSQMVQGRYLYVECKQTQNVADNTSTIHWSLVSTGGSSSFYTTGPTQIIIGGNLVYEKERVSFSTGQFPAAKGSVSGTTTVKHDAVTGEATIAVTIYTMIYNGVQDTRTEYWTLDANPRFAVLQNAPDFHDEENPAITYTNPAGAQVASLQACISLTGEKDDIAYRDIPKDATTYTFSLSEAERNVLRSAFPNANSGSVQFCVRSEIGGNTQVSTLSRTFSVKDPDPVITPTVVDSNDATFALTGDRGKLTAESIALATKTVYVGGDLNTYYPVRIYTYNDVATPQYLFVKKHLGSESPAWTENHASGTSSLVAGWMYRSMGWDGNGSYISTLYKHEPYAKLLGHVRLGKNAANSLVVWLRGGGATYYISSNLPITPTVYLTATNISTEAYPDNIAPITAIENGGVLFSNASFLLDRVYPINSIYISYSQTSPAELFGGTWTRINDKFLWATSSTTAGSIGVTGGESTHALTVDEMPAHTHNNKLKGGSQTASSSVYDWVSNSTAWQWYNLATESTGGGKAHNNMPPYIQVSIWRRVA